MPITTVPLYRTAEPRAGATPAFLCNGVNGLFSKDEDRNYFIPASANGYGLLDASAGFPIVQEPLPLPDPLNGQRGFFAVLTRPLRHIYSAFRVFTLPAGTQLPEGFDIRADPAGRHVIFPRRPHILTRRGIENNWYIESIAELDWQRTNFYKVLTGLDSPAPFVDGMDEAAHTVARTLNGWQSDPVCEELFLELVALQEELAASGYQRFSGEFYRRCIIAAAGMSIEWEERAEFQAMCAAATDAHVEPLDGSFIIG